MPREARRHAVALQLARVSVGAKRVAEVSRAPHEPCIFCQDPTRVRISVKAIDKPGEPEASRRICVACFKGIVDCLTEGRGR